jgi:hypothetical protein
MDKTLDPKPVIRKALEDRSYATVAKESQPKGKEPMVSKKAKTGESRRRCQVTLMIRLPYIPNPRGPNGNASTTDIRFQI